MPGMKKVGKIELPAELLQELEELPGKGPTIVSKYTDEIREIIRVYYTQKSVLSLVELLNRTYPDKSFTVYGVRSYYAENFSKRAMEEAK
jgi:hypothetical protein